MEQQSNGPTTPRASESFPPQPRRANRNTCRSSATTGCTWCVRTHLRVRHNGSLINLARGKTEALWRTRGDLSHAVPCEMRLGGPGRGRESDRLVVYAAKCILRAKFTHAERYSLRSFDLHGSNEPPRASASTQIRMFTIELSDVKMTRLLIGG